RRKNCRNGRFGGWKHGCALACVVPTSRLSCAPVSESHASLRPVLAAVTCYTIWGFVPLLFQAIGRMDVDPWEILTHRTIWAVPVAGAFVAMGRQRAQLFAVLARPRVLAWLVVSAALIATNWVIFILAVNTGRVLQTS